MDEAWPTKSDNSEYEVRVEGLPNHNRVLARSANKVPSAHCLHSECTDLSGQASSKVVIAPEVFQMKWA